MFGRRFWGVEKESEMNLAEGLAHEIKRNQELLEAYASIGPAGMFGCATLKKDINDGIDAQASGDVLKMLQIYEVLKNNE